MNKMQIPFSPPDISDSEIEEVCDTLRSGWITTGPKVKKFENEIAKYVGVGASASGTPRCVCLNSQTAAAEMALRLLDVGPGDEVITTAYTYTATASVVCHVGAKLVLIDTQKDSPEMDYDALENAIGERTKVIIPVDLAGIPCDYDRIFDIAEKKKDVFNPTSDIQKAIGRIVILADTAHSFGAELMGKKSGSIADFSATSFHAVKNLTTAEGGALTWRAIPGISDDEVYRMLQLMSLHGQNKDALAKIQPGAWEYDIVGTWYKCNMTDIMASIGLAQLARYPELLARRRAIIEKYDAAFSNIGIQVLRHYTDKYRSSGHLYLTRIPGISTSERNEIIVKMADAGVMCNVHYKPLPMHTAYKKLGFSIEAYPNAYEQFANEITLPLHTGLSDEQIDYVIEKFCSIAGEYIK